MFNSKLTELRNKSLEMLPLAIKRFCLAKGSDPISAISESCEHLLSKYFEVIELNDPRIRLLDLCKLLDIKVENINLISNKVRHYSLDESVRSKKKMDARLSIDNGTIKIILRSHIPRSRARIAVAHEIGHWLLRSENNSIEEFKLGVDTTWEEELLVEYCARKLLLHDKVDQFLDENNVALRCIKKANFADTTIHSAVSRLGDPDQNEKKPVAAILWRLNPVVSHEKPIYMRLSPSWKVCDNFIPIMKCRARDESIIAKVAQEEPSCALENIEKVNIGTLEGEFEIHAFGWGSIQLGTKVVLSIFYPFKD